MLSAVPGRRESGCADQPTEDSPHQLSYVTHSGSGEGLLFYGDTAIHFVDRFPKDTELYTLLTTKSEDKANEQNDEKASRSVPPGSSYRCKSR